MLSDLIKANEILRQYGTNLQHLDSKSVLTFAPDFQAINNILSGLKADVQHEERSEVIEFMKMSIENIEGIEILRVVSDPKLCELSKKCKAHTWRNNTKDKGSVLTFYEYPENSGVHRAICYRDSRRGQNIDMTLTYRNTKASFEKTLHNGFVDCIEEVELPDNWSCAIYTSHAQKSATRIVLCNASK